MALLHFLPISFSARSFEKSPLTLMQYDPGIKVLIYKNLPAHDFSLSIILTTPSKLAVVYSNTL